MQAYVSFPPFLPKPPLHLNAAETIPSDDVNELLSLVKQLEGFPTDPKEDLYGLDTRLALTTFEVQWDNGDEVEGAEGPTEENKQTFKDVVDSVQALARAKAK